MEAPESGFPCKILHFHSVALIGKTFSVPKSPCYFKDVTTP